MKQKALLQKLCRHWPIERLWLFGSRARGKARRGSDYDLLVDFTRGYRPSLFDLGLLQRRFSKALAAPVDVIERHPGLPPSFFKHARPLFERN